MFNVSSITPFLQNKIEIRIYAWLSSFIVSFTNREEDANLRNYLEILVNTKKGWLWVDLCLF